MFSLFVMSSSYVLAIDCTEISVPTTASDSASYCSQYVGCTGPSEAPTATSKCANVTGSVLSNSSLLNSATKNSGMSTSTTVPQIIGSVIRVILSVSGTVALIFIIWGGIKWMISKGKEDSIKEARKLMTSGMIGIAIIAAAYAITDFVIKQITVVAGA